MSDPVLAAKGVIHDALQDMSSLHPSTAGFTLTRWVAVTEVVGPDGHVVMHTSASADGLNLKSWEINGLMLDTLADRVRHG